jgi:hypothetical protein
MFHTSYALASLTANEKVPEGGRVSLLRSSPSPGEMPVI